MCEITSDQLTEHTICNYADRELELYRTSDNPKAVKQRDIHYMCAFADEQLTTEVMNFAHLATLATIGLEHQQTEQNRTIEATDFDHVILNINILVNCEYKHTEITLTRADAIELFKDGHEANIVAGVCLSITVK